MTLVALFGMILIKWEQLWLILEYLKSLMNESLLFIAAFNEALCGG